MAFGSFCSRIGADRSIEIRRNLGLVQQSKSQKSLSTSQSFCCDYATKCKKDDLKHSLTALSRSSSPLWCWN